MYWEVNISDVKRQIPKYPTSRVVPFASPHITPHNATRSYTITRPFAKPITWAGTTNLRLIALANIYASKQVASKQQLQVMNNTNAPIHRGTPFTSPPIARVVDTVLIGYIWGVHICRYMRNGTSRKQTGFVGRRNVNVSQVRDRGACRVHYSL